MKKDNASKEIGDGAGKNAEENVGTNEQVLAEYIVSTGGEFATILIRRSKKELVDVYEVRHAKVKEATQVALDWLREKIIESVPLKVSELLDPREAESVRFRVYERAKELVSKELAGLNPREEDFIVGKLVHEMLGLGEIELILADDNLEEIVVNSVREPIWVYHKKFGWLKTNVYMQSEEQIQNYSSIIGRKVGKQISNLSPLMDAHLLSGDRVNATLFPISTKGNGITIRKFAKDPWTVITLIDNKTLNFEIASLFWLGVQYELNMLIGGGTASGKTSLLNAILEFSPSNQRIVSIEDTRELVLPDFLHWTPLSTRQANPEGKGGVEMLDLMVNSLRMRPDRIVVGEIRRQREAEVMFEAMHTGHAVYSTVHADNVAQVKTRLVNPPIALPESVLGALHLVAVQYRQRRTGIRRVFEVAEAVPKPNGTVDFNTVYKWDARKDVLVKVGQFKRVMEDLSLHTGWTTRELNQDLKEKEKLLYSMKKHNVLKINEIGKVVAEYYRNREYVLSLMNKDKGFGEIML